MRDIKYMIDIRDMLQVNYWFENFPFSNADLSGM